MASVRQKGTKPELIVRKLLHGLGYRFRLHAGDLPGKPDIVFKGRHKIIFVHGCFWHGHDCDHGRRQPQSNQAYWFPKIERNRVRDVATTAALSSKGWSIKTVWECELQSIKKVARELAEFLGPAKIC
jgi:DNA mismatch endonuclease (patch repair protein)